MSYANGTSFEVQQTKTKDFQLDPSPLYAYPAKDSIIPLATCPLNSETRVVESPWSNGTNFVFNTRFNQVQFVGNCIKLFFDIPLTVTLTTPATEQITEANFLEKLFNNNQDITYSQYSVMQCLSNLNIALNGNNLINPVNIADAFNAVSQYYASEDVDEWFQASQPDRFQSFETYSGASQQALSYFDELGQKTWSTMDVENENNIFKSKYPRAYIPRTPQWKWGNNPDAAERSKFNVKLTAFCYVPLTMFGVPSGMTALSGITELNVAINMRQDMAHQLLNIKRPAPGSPYRYSNIEIDSSSYTKSTSRMLLQIYSAPNYMIDKIVDPRTGLMQPYSISYPNIMTHVGESYTAAPGDVKSFNKSDIQVNSVPESIYISIVKRKVGTFQEVASTPINYGLLRNLTVKVDSAVTPFNDIISLAYVADTNGYNCIDQIGRLTKGFTLKLDVKKDLSLPGKMVVGASGVFRIAVEGSFINQGDLESKYQLIVTTVQPSSLDFDGVNFSQTSGVLIETAMLNTANFLETQYSMYQSKVNVMGGGIFSDAGKWIKKNGISLVKGLYNNRAEIAKQIGNAVSLAKTLKGGAGQYGLTNMSGAGPTRTMGAGSKADSIFK